VNPARPRLVPTDIYSLADELIRAQFAVGTDQIVAAIDLCVALPLSGQTDGDAAAFKHYLAPVFARSKDDQERFYTLYDDWCRRRAAVHPPTPSSIEARKPPAPVTLPSVRRWPFLVGAAALFALAFGVFAGLRWHEKKGAVQQPLAVLPPDRGPELAAAPAGGTAGGQPLIVLPDVTTASPPRGKTVVSSTPAEPVQANFQIASVLGAAPVSRWSWKPEPWWQAVSLLPLVALLCWWLWQWRWRNVWLRHARRGGPLDITHFRVRGASEGIIANDFLRRIVANLTVRRRVPTRELNVPATVAATVAAGALRPVLAVRTRVPEYLVLIDQNDYRDQLARHADALMSLLGREGVELRVLHFSADPRICHAPPPGRERSTLQELVVRERHRRLVVVSDGAGLVDSSDRPVAWATAFDQFTDKVLLTPQPAEHWGARERNLRDTGWVVSAFDGRGLDGFGRAMVARADDQVERAPVHLPPRWRRRFPSLLDHDPERWLEPAPSSPAQVAQLEKQLRVYLGEDGAYLLAAAAIYPRIDVGLTLFLDQRLLDSEPQRTTRPERLLRAAQLPWFRHGFMPTYLRAALVASLTLEQMDRARQAFEVLLSSALETKAATPEGGTLVLEVARPSRRRGLLSSLMSNAPPGSPLRDVVLAEVMSRRRAGRLAVALPRALRSRLSTARLRDSLRPVVAVLASVMLWRAPGPAGSTESFPQTRSGKLGESLAVAGELRGGPTLTRATVPVVLLGAGVDQSSLTARAAVFGRDTPSRLASAEGHSVAVAIVYPWFEGMHVESAPLVDRLEEMLRAFPSRTTAFAVPYGDGFRSSAKVTTDRLAEGELAEVPLIPYGTPDPLAALGAAVDLLSGESAPMRVLVAVVEGREVEASQAKALGDLRARVRERGIAVEVVSLFSRQTADRAAELLAFDESFARAIADQVAFVASTLPGPSLGVPAVVSFELQPPWWSWPFRWPAEATLVSGKNQVSLALGPLSLSSMPAKFGLFAVAILALGVLSWAALRWPVGGLLFVVGWFVLGDSHWMIGRSREPQVITDESGATPAPDSGGSRAAIVDETKDTGGWVGHHIDRVLSAEFSRDGRLLVSASADQTAQLWDAFTGQAVGPPLQHGGPVGIASFSPDGKRVVTASGDTARLWDSLTGRPLGSPLRHDKFVAAAAFSPDGKRVVTASSDKTARLWDSLTGRPLGPPLRHEGFVFAASFSPDGKRVVTASEDHTARLWDAFTGRPLGPPLRQESPVVVAAFSPDGGRVVTAGRAGDAGIWDVKTGQKLSELVSNDGVSSVKFSPDGRAVMTAGGAAVRIWDGQTGIPRASLPQQERVWNANYSPDGSRIVTISGEVALWDSTTLQRIAAKQRSARFGAFSPDGKNLMIGWGNVVEVIPVAGLDRAPTPR
jgi:WD40 repeat protein